MDMFDEVNVQPCDEEVRIQPKDDEVEPGEEETREEE